MNIDKFRTTWLEPLSSVLETPEGHGIEVEWAAEMVAALCAANQLVPADAGAAQSGAAPGRVLDYMEIKRMQGIRAMYPRRQVAWW